MISFRVETVRQRRKTHREESTTNRNKRTLPEGSVRFAYHLISKWLQINDTRFFVKRISIFDMLPHVQREKVLALKRGLNYYYLLYPIPEVDTLTFCRTIMKYQEVLREAKTPYQTSRCPTSPYLNTRVLRQKIGKATRPLRFLQGFSAYRHRCRGG